ncbi:hypothetical protein [Bifidobacterium crudilactis]|jgi:uncharacterized membrane protein|uniref:hypothetical protein n=1 Tax=Bifidobacterium crudilactis TaxID=327277 RepID=UPI002354DB18|nr:hypothetical protein [Bifidobacterium crudilactis]MCI1218504.1 hypothetical protein [Bifidobacterium crudilactis]
MMIGLLAWFCGLAARVLWTVCAWPVQARIGLALLMLTSMLLLRQMARVSNTEMIRVSMGLLAGVCMITLILAAASLAYTFLPWVRTLLAAIRWSGVVS